MRCFVAVLAWTLLSGPASAADLTDAAIRAYDEYFAAARQAFVSRATSPASRHDPDSNRNGDGVVAPGAGDGILAKPESLIHHWRGEIFLPDVTLDQVIAVSRDYPGYPRIFKPVRAATVLPSPDQALRVRFRMRGAGGGLSATFDVRSRIQWVRVGEQRVYVVSTSEEIHEVTSAGKPTERLLPEGRDSGYLWRAASMTRFAADGGGVWMAMETVGLSRPFPPLLGWMLEPIARRVGRRSVAESMTEFARAVRDRSTLSP